MKGWRKISLNLLIGRKNVDRNEITVKADGGDSRNKLLYKYYRTPERIDAFKAGFSNRYIFIWCSNIKWSL